MPPLCSVPAAPRDPGGKRCVIDSCCLSPVKVEPKRSSAANYSIGAAPTLGIAVDVRALPVENSSSTSCYVDVKSPNRRMLFFLMTLLLPRPKRDLLLCVARHTAVTLTRNAPLSKAQSPGLSVSANEPSGVFDFSRFC